MAEVRHAINKGSSMIADVRRWAAGMGLAGGAVVAAGMIGAASAPPAHADGGSLTTDIGLLNAAESNIENAFSLSGQTDTILPHLINQLEAIQTPLLSSDNSFVSGWGDFLFNGPDQQLAQSSGAFLSAGEAYAADPSPTTGLGEVSPFFQFIDSLFLETLPANVIGKLTDDVLGYETPIAGAAADVATSASPTPDEVIGQAIADLNQGTALLDAAPTADLSARQAETLVNSINFDTELDSPLAQMATLQDGFSAADQTYLASADEQLVTAAANILSADQAFVAADQAGDLSGSSFNATDLTLIESALGLLNADLNVGGAELFALFTGGLDPSSVADFASSIDPVTAVDPSVFADLLSSIGL